MVLRRRKTGVDHVFAVNANSVVDWYNPNRDGISLVRIDLIDGGGEGCCGSGEIDGNGRSGDDVDDGLVRDDDDGMA